MKWIVIIISQELPLVPFLFLSCIARMLDMICKCVFVIGENYNPFTQTNVHDEDIWENGYIFDNM